MFGWMLSAPCNALVRNAFARAVSVGNPPVLSRCRQVWCALPPAVVAEHRSCLTSSGGAGATVAATAAPVPASVNATTVPTNAATRAGAPHRTEFFTVGHLHRLRARESRPAPVTENGEACPKAA